MSLKERIDAVLERWFLTSPLMTTIAASHVIDVVEGIGCPIRVRSGHIEIDPAFYGDKSDRFLEESMKVECMRILLRHPYERILPDSERLLKASNLVISNNLELKELHMADSHDVFGVRMRNDLSMEEYYDMLGKDDNMSYSDDTCMGKSDADARTAGWGDDGFQRVRIENMVSDMEKSGAIGQLPGNLKSVIEAAGKVVFDYKAVFRRFRSTLLSSERRLTRMRPSRRFGFDAMGSTRGFTTKVLLAVDTSGSISERDLAKVVDFICGMFRYGIEALDVIEFDEIVYEDTLRTLTRKFRRLKVTGRGGTGFDDVFRYVGGHYYDGVIIVTDGMADVPKSRYLGIARKTSFMWCLNSRAAFDRMNSRPGFTDFGKTTYFV